MYMYTYIYIYIYIGAACARENGEDGHRVHELRDLGRIVFVPCHKPHREAHRRRVRAWVIVAASGNRSATLRILCLMKLSKCVS